MMTSEMTAERMRSVADRILASKRPSASRVAAELRSILKEVEAVPAEAVAKNAAMPDVL